MIGSHLLSLLLATGETAEGVESYLIFFFWSLFIFLCIAASFAGSIGLVVAAFRKTTRRVILVLCCSIYAISIVLCLLSVTAMFHSLGSPPAHFDWTLKDHPDPFVRVLFYSIYLTVLLIIPNVVLATLALRKNRKLPIA